MHVVVPALSLLLLAQVPAPRLVTPDDAAAPDAGAAVAQAAPAPAPPPAAEPAPAPAPPPAAEPPAGEAQPAPGTGAEPPPSEPPARAGSQAKTPPAADRPRHVSLVGAEPLRGASAALAWAGWSSVGAAYAIGFSQVDDLGAYLDFDWARSETRAGLFYRRPFATLGGFDAGARLAVAYFSNFGSEWFFERNNSDRGFEVAPAVVLSQRAAGGVFAATGEAPLTVTGKYGAGVLFTPRLSLAFEVPLYPQVTVGARMGAAYRAGAGSAPLREGRGELQFLVLAGYEL